MEAARAPSRRERARVQTLAEIKATALRQMAARGTASVGIREIAREMGLTPSALYRYVDGRDALITLLVIDAYDASAAVVEAAVAAAPPGDGPALWTAVATALRAWALEHPTEWALIYGSPIPGYEAPPETRPPGTRAPLALVGALAELARTADAATRRRWRSREADADAALLGELRPTLELLGHPDLPAVVFLDGLTAWTNLLGFISMEVFGQLSFAVTEHAGALFQREVADVAQRLLPGGPGATGAGRP